MTSTACALVSIVASAAPALAAQGTKQPAGAVQGQNASAWFEGWDNAYQYSAALIVSAFGLGLIFFLVTSLVVWRAREGLSGRYMKVTLLLFVLLLALSVSVSGFEEKTTNAMLGLVGTIAGYLLGRVDRVTTTPPATGAATPPCLLSRNIWRHASAGRIAYLHHCTTKLELSTRSRGLMVTWLPASADIEQA
jgi:hypothetical protein